jgi:hypothetical protein
MKMSFTRSGGFGGMTLHMEIEDRDMPASERKRLRSIVVARDTRSTLRSSADEYRYELLLLDEEGKRRLTWTDSSLPTEAVPLIEWLTKKARE